MKYDLYPNVKVNPDFSVLDFISVGHKGNIPKRITFAPTYWPNMYNLAFGDITEDDDIDDQKISDNGDRNKILSTVLRAVELYTEKYPDRWIYFAGSTAHRTRLYRMAVSLHLEELSKTFDIFAEIEGKDDLVRFEKGLNISAFVVKRKFIKFTV
jgi:hypothetical protein